MISQQDRELILNIVNKYSDTGISFQALFKKIMKSKKSADKNISEDELRGILDDLSANCKLMIVDDVTIFPYDEKKFRKALVSSTGSKVYLVDQDSQATILFSRDQFPCLIDGDEVVYLSAPKNEFVEEAVFIKITKATDKPIVCRATRDRDGHLFFQPENLNKYYEFAVLVDDDECKSLDAELVAIKITERNIIVGKYHRIFCRGTIVEILGSATSTETQVKIAILQHGIPSVFPKAVLDQIENIADEVQPQDRIGHRDITKLPLITIDGEDARDFDDAVYAEKLQRPEGGWRLYVAIADVSYYVRKGTPLDKSAYERGNSVYFPDMVVPMLPVKLSNGLCSLNPNVDRLCMTCEMIVSAQGELESYEFYPAVMRSHARMTYTKVHNIFEGDPKLIDEYQDIVPHLINLLDMYKALDKARNARGAIEFESEEVKFFYDDNHKIEDIQPLVRNEAHMLIEECMILANIAAAKFIEGHSYKTVFRIHPNPTMEKILTFRKFLAAYGLQLGGGDDPQPHDYADFISRISEREDAQVFHMMMLRSLSKAVYSPENCGHFGLALKQYAHFTSPIRRYPDLMLHREIKYFLALDAMEKVQHGTTVLGGFHYEIPSLVVEGEHCSETERRADEATYEVATWLKCEFMQDKLGKEFEGVITNVTSFGLFVQLMNWHIDGLVYVGNLGQDYFIFNPDNQTLIGQNSGVHFKIGETIKVIVDSINTEEKRINFLLANPLSSLTVKAKKKKKNADQKQKQDLKDQKHK